jgi:hypothetical protein
MVETVMRETALDPNGSEWDATFAKGPNNFVCYRWPGEELGGYVPYYDQQCRPAGGRPGVLEYKLTDR